MDRREFIQGVRAALAAGMAASVPLRIANAQARRKMTISLNCGAIGVKATQIEAIEHAVRHGFESVEPLGRFLASLTEQQAAELVAQLKSRNLRWGTAGLPVEFRRDEERFKTDLAELPKVAAALKRVGAERMATWIMPCHDTLTYMANFKLHAERLREVATVLKDHGLRLGLEYVGPRTLMTSKRYAFLRTMAETRNLIDEIGTGNAGYLLDSFHWWTSGDTEQDLLGLTNEQVVSVDLNDGVAGVPRDEQLDQKRELPCATGVIDIATFLKALVRIGYDGPVRAEPFSQALRAMPAEEALASTAAAMRKAFTLLE